MRIIDQAAASQAPVETLTLPSKAKRQASLPTKTTATDDVCHKASKPHNSDSHKTTTDDRKYAVSAETDSESNTSDSENTEQKVIYHLSTGMHIHKECRYANENESINVLHISCDTVHAHHVSDTKHILTYVHTYLKVLMQQWTANTFGFGKHLP